MPKKSLITNTKSKELLESLREELANCSHLKKGDSVPAQDEMDEFNLRLASLDQIADQTKNPKQELKASEENKTTREKNGTESLRTLLRKIPPVKFSQSIDFTMVSNPEATYSGYKKQ